MKLGSVSFSAWLVMRCQLMLPGQAQWSGFIPQADLDVYRACYDYCERHFPFCKMVGTLPGGLIKWGIEQALIKGAPLHYSLRKRYIRDYVNECIQRGATQLVVIGSGFDALAYTVAKSHAQVQCFEIDKPSMHENKAAALSEGGLATPENYKAIAADLSQITVGELLAGQPDFAPGALTILVAEGLTMYLDGHSVEALFKSVTSLCSGGIHVIMTAVEAHVKPTGLLASGIQKVGLLMGSERFSWSIERHALPAFFERFGLQVKDLTTYYALQERHVLPSQLPSKDESLKGEYMIYAATA